MSNNEPLSEAEIEMDEIGTLINHETTPHCCGCYTVQYGNKVGLRLICNECGHTVDLLTYVRASQSPRLTDAQVAALHIAQLRCKEEGSLTDVVEILESTFPGVFGE